MFLVWDQVGVKEPLVTADDGVETETKVAVEVSWGPGDQLKVKLLEGGDEIVHVVCEDGVSLRVEDVTSVD